MRNSSKLAFRMLLCFISVVPMLLSLRYHGIAQPLFGRHSEIVSVSLCIAFYLAVLLYTCRDNMTCGRWWLRRGRADKAIREFELGVDDYHVGAAIGLGDMLLSGYQCTANPDRALALYRFAFDCMIEYEESKPGFMMQRTIMMEPARYDSGDLSRNRTRLRNMGMNLEAAGDLSDPETRALLCLIFDRLGDYAGADKYSE